MTIGITMNNNYSVYFKIYNFSYSFIKIFQIYINMLLHKKKSIQKQCIFFLIFYSYSFINLNNLVIF